MIAKVTTPPANTAPKNAEKASGASESSEAPKKGLFGSILESVREAVEGGSQQAGGQTADGKNAKDTEDSGKAAAAPKGDASNAAGDAKNTPDGSLTAALTPATGKAVEVEGDKAPAVADAVTQDTDNTSGDTTSGEEGKVNGKVVNGKKTDAKAAVSLGGVELPIEPNASQGVQSEAKAVATETDGKEEKQADVSPQPVDAEKGEAAEKKVKVVKEAKNLKTPSVDQSEGKDNPDVKPKPVEKETAAKPSATPLNQGHRAAGTEKARPTVVAKEVVPATATTTKADGAHDASIPAGTGKATGAEATEIKGQDNPSSVSKTVNDVEPPVKEQPAEQEVDTTTGKEKAPDQHLAEQAETGPKATTGGQNIRRPATNVRSRFRPATTTSQQERTERPAESNAGAKPPAAQASESQPADGGVKIAERVLSEQGGMPVSAVKSHLKGTKADRIREQKYGKYVSSFGKRAPEVSDSSNTDKASPGASAPAASRPQADVPGVFTLKANGSETDFKGADEIKNWKDQSGDVLQFKQDKGSDGAPHIMRMAQAPITNLSVRRNVLPGLTRVALKASAGSGKAAGQGWQKHSIELENGKNINVSARKVDGVIQLKLSTLHNDLGKLLQQHQQEIRQHLERECDLKVDLQFDGHEGQDQTSGFFGDSSSSRQGQQGFGRGRGDQTSSKTVEQVIPKSVRNFGYNKMEWIA